jgi:DNA-binding beta-propeller fold protein YncE
MSETDAINIDEQRKYIHKMWGRYREQDKGEKGRLLDEIEAVTGMHRKAIIRWLNGRLSRKKRTRERGREYGVEVGNAEGQFNDPQGLAVDRDGCVIVVDRGNNRLVVLSFDGHTFGYLDSFTAGFNAPTSVSVSPTGNLVVADTGSNRIVVLDPQGNFLVTYNQPNDGYTGLFNAPRSMVVDHNGDLVVIYTGNARVVSVRTIKQIWLSMLFSSTK